MVHISFYDVEYTITMYLHYQKKYRGMLTAKQIKKLHNEYSEWIMNPDNRYGDECVYNQIKSLYFRIASIEFDPMNPHEFIVWYGIEWGSDLRNIRLQYRGYSDHSGIFNVIERGIKLQDE